MFGWSVWSMEYVLTLNVKVCITTSHITYSHIRYSRSRYLNVNVGSYCKRTGFGIIYTLIVLVFLLDLETLHLINSDSDATLNIIAVLYYHCTFHSIPKRMWYMHSPFDMLDLYITFV